MDYDKLFEEKSGYTIDQLEGEYNYRFNTDDGFFVLKLGTEEEMFVPAVCGNGKKLIPYILDKGRELGYKRVVFRTKRNPKVWERAYGMKIKEYVLEKEL